MSEAFDEPLFRRLKPSSAALPGSSLFASRTRPVTALQDTADVMDDADDRIRPYRSGAILPTRA